MYTKLFAITGGFWIMEFISWAVGCFSNTEYELDAEPSFVNVWLFFDVLNCLRGVWLLIFCVFLSKRVCTTLKRKFFSCHGIQRGATTSSMTRNMTTVSSTRGSHSEHDLDQVVEMKEFIESTKNEDSPTIDDGYE